MWIFMNMILVIVYLSEWMVLVFQEKLDLQDKLTDVQAEYNAVYSEHEELKQKFEKERQCTGTVSLFFLKEF